MQLQQLDYLPDGLLSAPAEQLHAILHRPTLIHLPGKQSKPLYLSVLLHGNEPTGLIAVQALLHKYQAQQLPRAVSIFFGNTLAAEQGVRRLNLQPDFNRVWPGTELPESPESRMAAEIVAIMQQQNPFASIDIHNNTGHNPHYACINKLENSYLQLACLFGRLIVYFIRPKGVQSAAFAEFCPAVTLECGRPGQQNGIEHALDFLDTCLHLREIPQAPVASKNIDLFHTVAQVSVKDQIDLSFNRPSADLYLNEDLEWMNFTEIPPGTALGKVKNGMALPLLVKDERGQDISSKFFSINEQELQINRATMPSMLTLDEKIIKQDCLCYLMERIQL